MLAISPAGVLSLKSLRDVRRQQGNLVGSAGRSGKGESCIESGKQA